MYFNVNFNMFFELIIVNLLASELYKRSLFFEYVCCPIRKQSVVI